MVRVSLSYPAFEWARRRVLNLRLRRRRLRRLTAGGATGVGSTDGTASLIGHWRRLLTARSSIPNQQWSQSAAIIPDNTIIEQHRLVKHIYTHNCLCTPQDFQVIFEMLISILWPSVLQYLELVSYYHLNKIVTTIQSDRTLIIINQLMDGHF